MVAMASLLHYRTVVATVLALMMVTTEAFRASDWQPAHATFYGDSSGLSDDMGTSTSDMLSLTKPYNKDFGEIIHQCK
jgi:hypothetical protein